MGNRRRISGAVLDGPVIPFGRFPIAVPQAVQRALVALSFRWFRHSAVQTFMVHGVAYVRFREVFTPAVPAGLGAASTS
jgi:hypothetical protein